MERRRVLKWALAGASALALPVRAGPVDGRLAERLAQLERRSGGRLGVAFLDVASGRLRGYRLNQRALMCSTFKLALVAAVLARADRGREQLERRLPIREADLLSHAPVTRRHVGAAGMRIDALCAAAITLSDNTAANLLLATLGGPAALTAWLRQTGDDVTRLDRTEPTLNISAGPDDARDTTTPAAMAATAGRLLFGETLSHASRGRLRDWMRGCSTGLQLIRSGLPPGWVAGDKTGGGAHGERNDVAFALRPDAGPLIVAAFFRPADSRDGGAAPRALAAVGRLATVP